MNKKKLKADTGLHKIITLHHYIIPVPNIGTEKKVLNDTKDILLLVI